MVLLHSCSSPGMSHSLKVFNIPRGMEQDLVRLLMNNRFSLTRYAVNNSSPYDTVIEFSDINMGPRMEHFLKNEVVRLRGQPVKLDAQLVSTKILFLAL